MLAPRFGRLVIHAGLLAASSVAAGCFLSNEDAGSESSGATSGSSADVLKSTLLFDGGCMAVKVGPRHLLTAARCVDGKAAIAAGATLRFEQASLVTADDRAPSPDAGTADSGADAGAGAGATEDAGSAPSRNLHQARIARVEIHPSYTAKCKVASTCGFGALGASAANDIAVVILDADLVAVPTIPIDLDPVGQSDKVMAVGSDCARFDATPAGEVKTFRTIAVPARAVKHDGSPYAQSPELVSRLDAAYVVTPAIGWRTGEPRLCKSDIGAPLVRVGAVAVAGITSNLTHFPDGDLPVTLHHTRVDTGSKVGTWLKSLGVQTTLSCSEAAGGCPKNGYDGGVPTAPTNDATSAGDGGVLVSPNDAGGAAQDDAGTPPGDLPSQGEATPITNGSGDNGDPYTGGGDDLGSEDDDAGAGAKKSASASGCSAAPAALGGNGMLVGLAALIAGALARRRRAR